MLLEQHRESTRGGLISPADRDELRQTMLHAQNKISAFCDDLSQCTSVDDLNPSSLHRSRELIDAASRLLKKMKAP
jgi:hypothetical protein